MNILARIDAMLAGVPTDDIDAAIMSAAKLSSEQCISRFIVHVWCVFREMLEASGYKIVRDPKAHP